MSERELLGRPIKGDSDDEKGNFHFVEQYSEERFLAELDALFASDSELTAVQWSQYTPYWNDGESCEFSAREDEAPLVFGGVPEYYVSYPEDDDDELEGMTFKSSYDIRPEGDWVWTDAGKREFQVAPGEEVSELYTAYSQFFGNLEAGHFEVVIRQNFGEHARVVATREGFAVEFYDHE